VATITLAAFGLRPLRRFQDGAATFMTNTYYVQNGYGTAIGYGDAVVLNSSGYIARYANGGANITGVFAGIQYYDTNLNQWITRPNYLGTETPATNINVQCFVVDDKTTVFGIQVGGAGAHNPVTQANIGDNADIVTTPTPTTAGISQEYLDSNNVATTATFPLKIIGFSQQFFLGFDPTVYAANSSATPPTNNYVEVILNTSTIYNTTGI
jgi:hypothetical protein